MTKFDNVVISNVRQIFHEIIIIMNENRFNDNENVFNQPIESIKLSTDN